MSAATTTDRHLDAEVLRATGALLAAHLAVSKAIEVEAVACTDYDTTTLDLLVRLDLADEGRLRAVELCRQLMLSPSHVSRRLDRAEAEGLVRRGPDPDDRRAQQISLTRKGRRVVADFAPRLEASITRITDVLDAGEKDVLVTLLGRLENAARAPCGPS